MQSVITIYLLPTTEILILPSSSLLPQGNAHLLHFLITPAPLQPLHYLQMEQARLFILALISLHTFSSVVCASMLEYRCADSGGLTEVRAGYWLPSSSHYSPVSSIDTSLYTHVYYSSLSIDETSSTVATPPADGNPLFATFSSVVKSSRNSAVKTILSIGTDEYKVDVSNAAFSRMAADKNLQKMFINSSIELARANGFDGLDLAWNFPATQMDMTNLGALLTEWRVKIMEESGNSSSEPLLLTATVYFSNHMFDTPDSNLDYPIDDMSTNLDWANVLTFGFHKNSNITTVDAALYDKSSHFSASYGIISWLDAGVSPCKLVMGIPLFGRSWFLRNKDKNGLGAPTVAAGTKQRKSNQTGTISFSEIEECLKSNSTTVTYDNESVAEYFYSDNLWVSFDSAPVVDKKIEYAARSRLLGYFLWTISFDDENCTISEQASVSWRQYRDSTYAQGGLETMQVGAVHQDMKSSAAPPGSWYPETLSYLLSSIVLLVVLFH